MSEGFPWDVTDPADTALFLAYAMPVLFSNTYYSIVVISVHFGLAGLRPIMTVGDVDRGKCVSMRVTYVHTVHICKHAMTDWKTVGIECFDIFSPKNSYTNT